VPDLPQIAINAVLYNAIVAGLFAALSWHVISLVTNWRRQRARAKVRSDRQR
jgi:hypothetical protein